MINQMIGKIKNICHFLIAYASGKFYGNPSKDLFVIGVTGTKGKSMTAELIACALKGTGEKAAVISSAHIVIGEKETKNMTGNTMPGKGRIQKILRKAVREGCKYAIIEVTSQGVLQHRHRFIDWDAAVFTNLHPEHIEHHGSFEKYREAKKDFFRYVAGSPKKNRMFFINEDDPNAGYFVEAAGNDKKVFFGGTFLKANYAAATAVAEALGRGAAEVEKALSDFKGLPGRMETVFEKPFRAIVDYAHTPDSLAEVYKWAALPIKSGTKKEGRLICVLGSAGGGRDKWKRPKMGEAAAKYCDEIIVTNEDPYDENPMDIINEVSKGAEEAGKNPIKILDRQEAIDKAISSAGDGDVVIMTGKGSEPYIHLAGGKKMAWSEKDAVLEAIKDRNALE